MKMKLWIKLFFVTVLFIPGIALLIWVDWRIALGVFLLEWSNNVDKNKRY